MTFSKIQTNRGLIKMIVLIIAILILLAYLGLNLRSIINSPTFVDNWAFIKSLTIDIWTKYLKGPVEFIWNSIFIPYVWDPVINNISKKATP